MNVASKFSYGCLVLHSHAAVWTFWSFHPLQKKSPIWAASVCGNWICIQSFSKRLQSEWPCCIFSELYIIHVRRNPEERCRQEDGVVWTFWDGEVSFQGRANVAEMWWSGREQGYHSDECLIRTLSGREEKTRPSKRQRKGCGGGLSEILRGWEKKDVGTHRRNLYYNTVIKKREKIMQRFDVKILP